MEAVIKSKQRNYPCSSGYQQDKKNAARGLLQKGTVRAQLSITTLKTWYRNLSFGM